MSYLSPEQEALVASAHRLRDETLNAQGVMPHVELTKHDEAESVKDLVGKLLDQADQVAPVERLEKGDVVKAFPIERLQGTYWSKVMENPNPRHPDRRFQAAVLDAGLREILGEYLTAYGKTPALAVRHLHYAYDLALHRRKIVLDPLQRKLIAARAKFPLSIS